MPRSISYVQAINEAMNQAMALDKSVICYGLGVDDPKHIFGTTAGLQESFGEQRVFDMPLSENAMTGVAIGASLNGVRPVMVHQRLDFFLLAMDQLVNSAAKWHYMFGGQDSVPITIRLIMGRGWGQGPTHAQNLQAWFAHIPGLKVVMPATASDAKGMLLASIFDDNPVLMLEHRWLHGTEGDVEPDYFETPLDQAAVAREGSDVSIVAMSYMTVEALHAAEFLAEQGVSCEVIDLRSIRPIDWQTINTSVNKTGRLLVLDTGVETGSVAGEIIAKVSTENFAALSTAPRRLALPDHPEPTSFEMTKSLYNRSEHVVASVAEMLDKPIDCSALIEQRQWPHDVPGDWFKGPF